MSKTINRICYGAAKLVFLLAISTVSYNVFHTQTASAAYSGNPVGYADYCQVVNGATVIGGWAHDPQAAAGALPNVTVKVTGQPAKTVPSSIAGYRDAPINSFLTAKGIAKSSVYGWTATYVGLYKGNSYA